MESINLASEILKNAGEGFGKFYAEFDKIGGIFSVLSALFSLIVLIQSVQANAREKKEIKIVLSNGGRRFELPGKLLCRELTRMEVLGRIGMLPMKDKGKRFSIDHLSKLDFLEALNKIISSGQNETLIIPCIDDEFNQFSL
jgi:hypothetical protein